MLAGTGRSQTYYFDNYSVSEGLAQSKVFAIIQDRNEYIWLGTEGGVSGWLAKKRAADRRQWLQEKGDLAEV